MVVTFCETFMELLCAQTFTERVVDMPELEASSAANAIAQALETSPVTTFNTFLIQSVTGTARFLSQSHGSSHRRCRTSAAFPSGETRGAASPDMGPSCCSAEVTRCPPVPPPLPHPAPHPSSCWLPYRSAGR